MDFEERERQRRRQFIKVVIAELGMFASVVAVVVIATLAAMGFFVTSDGSIEQSGLAQIHSIPSGASVELDGSVLFSRTNLSRSLAPGEHQLKITRDGYDGWEKTIKMYSGMLLRLYYPRLFLLNRTPESVLSIDSELDFYSVSDDRTSILYATDKSPKWQLLDIRGDDVRSTTLDLANVLPGVSKGKFEGDILESKWSNNGDYILLKVKYDEKNEWLLLSLKDVARSLNLTQTFGMDFEYLEMIDDSANQLFALENHQLRKINTADQSISRVLLADIQRFSSQDANIIYLTQSRDDEQCEIGIYRDGDKGGTIVARTDSDKVVHVALSKYYNEYYIAFTIDRELNIYYGGLPVYNENNVETDFSGLKVLVEKAQLEVVPDTVAVGDEGEYLVARKGAQFMVVDFDMGDLFEYQAPTSKLQWLNDSMMYSTNNELIKVWDFDFTNQRDLVETKPQDDVEANPNPVTTKIEQRVANYPVVISDNDRWMYYLVYNKENDLVLMREKMRN